jgi:large subunit ribosomal protein L10
VPLKLAEKQAIVALVAEYAQHATALFVAEYSGIKVSALTELRSIARQSGLIIRVVRNTLARRALANSKFSAVCDKLAGPLILTFAKEDPGVAARLLQDYSKKCAALKVMAISLGDSVVLPAASLAVVASMPNREQALAQLLATLQAPITNLARTMAEPCAQLVRVVAALAKQKQGAQEQES